MSVIRPRRTKIGKDPNNTAWARDETTFGQRFMRSQGWQPGDVLGDPNSGHAGMHSAASTSHIRVTLKDDSNGLGWKPGGPDGDDALTGMDVLKDIFGRLNGKGGEEGRREQERKKGLMYLGRRGGRIAFVRGGLLVGDEMKVDKTKDAEEQPTPAPADAPDAKLKRKRDNDDDDDDNDSGSSSSSSDSSDNDSEAERQARKRRKAEKKEKKAAKKAAKAVRKAAKAARKEAAALASAGTTPASSSSSSSSDTEGLTDAQAKAARKAAKKEKKRAKKEKKEKKELKKKAREQKRQSRVVVRSRLSTHKKAPLDSDAMKRLFMVG